ncbi:DUF1786 domain-containing protein [Phorcysia thermohydrogeniphila]|uniref:Uncharacterized protein (DUF1786 family) n=1 Tax=Phorcysia thermohydrogeniphila TaxID=936138 RepID=A0A4R1GHT8_9BACT|nr:DUF1786 domain-containing protein [Phorcysia thermohydrogeniphila]TCK06345.1 uncharacterized protein (DUF1786 family) [Phorcysia thermohydrogeniphila]
MEVFAVDIGKGTQDLLYADENLNVENWVKAILPSPTVKLARRVASFNEDLFIDGYVMGGGPVKKAIINHLNKGYRVVISERAARTIKDDLEKVRSLGIDIADRVEKPNLYLSDLEFNVYEELLRLAGRPFNPKVIAVACQDHGFIKGQSDRVTRFKYFEKKLEETRDPRDFIVTEKTGFFSRFDSILEQLREKGFSGFVMDSKVASICGILAYAKELGVKEFVGLDIGNGHTLGVSIKDGNVCGLFEHHTRYLTAEKLKALVEKLCKATLTFEEVFLDNGHGAVVFEKVEPEKVFIAGPNRALFKKYGEYAFPGGDVMITGCVGLLFALNNLP